MTRFGNCKLGALPAGPGRRNEYMRCETCSCIVPISDVTNLRPGECPGQQRADELGEALYAGAYTGLSDWCKEQGWEILLDIGPPRPDLDREHPPRDLVLEVHGDGPGLPAAVRVPHEGELDRYAAGVLRGLLELQPGS